MTSNQYKVYAVLFFFAVGTWFLADFFDEDEVKKIVIAEHSPDYFSFGYYKKEMDATGELKSELNAVKMIHYSDDGRTHLDNPIMILYNPNVPPWVIKSKTGILEADGDHLLLTGKVNISRESAKGVKPFKINTSELRVKLSVSYAETDHWGEIIDGSNRTAGVGLKATFSYPVKVNFLSKVKGRYEVN